MCVFQVNVNIKKLCLLLQVLFFTWEDREPVKRCKKRRNLFFQKEDQKTEE